ncbi:large conductance mechanosensitive channel protein MscL [Chryseobacterium daecheongense]|uniref:Large-conductance mechanosensitive channel n=1 Tax=Chryseobacterium daecheongense TaxID=192389 RepID=A0A3N0W2Y2_9FLAO|nr:large conductance mechanosensitive channel protein MscL [Chryseobacterium daecheongense]ROH99344.1 large conductance mechanosensitive channel protein MscL [Chryseobacterium daecheongense]TDX95762.1 large conductance mechanosensitive channel [Chryseobacterium daecheongense]UOU97945.1 large conductance mechanosensitive channel protein MscL [Chryseobacterium daecheongense]
MGFIKEFKEFAIKGNVIDLAVGVIIGGAFGKIVSSFVEDVITPLLLNPAMKAAGADNIKELAWNGVTYGNFLSAVINFFCIALVLFIMIKGINRISKKEEPAPAGPTDDQKLLTEIRDLLKSNRNV